MREAVIVSTARTPIGRAYRGAFNDTQAQALAGHVVAEAVRRAGIDPAEVEDVVLGAALQQGSTGFNVARQAAVRAGLPVSVAGMTIDRQCSSGLMAIATAAKEIVHDGMTIAVGGGLESISLVQNDKRNQFRAQDPWLVEKQPDLYMTMIETAEIVAERYQVTREAQDEYALLSQQRTAAAQTEGRFDQEIAPMPSVMRVDNRETGETSYVSVTLDKDEGNRPSTTLAGLAALKPVFRDGQTVKEGRFITAGNASQLSDGAAASVLMEAKRPSAVGCTRSAPIAGSRLRAAHRTRWGSVRSSRYPSCCSSMGSRSMTSVCGSSTRRSPFRLSIAETGSASIPSDTMSMAARSRSVTLMGCRARAWSAMRWSRAKGVASAGWS